MLETVTLRGFGIPTCNYLDETYTYYFHGLLSLKIIYHNSAQLHHDECTTSKTKASYYTGNLMEHSEGHGNNDSDNLSFFVQLGCHI